jgi:hypothetical protein
MSFFFLTENRNVNQVLSGGVGTSGKGEDIRKGCQRVNIVEILFIPA